jgi:hypothetical protein
MNFTRRAIIASSGLVPALALASKLRAEDASKIFTVQVPIDHDEPSRGSIDLPCEWVAPPQPGRRTVLVIADAQQFYVRPGGAARISQSLFGDRFNLLAIVGRSRAEGIAKLLGRDGTTDWHAAWRIFRARQWIGDIDAVLRSVGGYGDPRQLMLYGRSGGAFLIQQAIVRNPGIASRLFMQAGVNHELDVLLGSVPDRFWPELRESDPLLGQRLLAFFRTHPQDRSRAIALLQRMHFFVPAADLAATRKLLIEKIIARDATALAEFASLYQLDALAALRSTPEGIASTVRLAEFALPHRDPRLVGDHITPDIEQLFITAEPVMTALDAAERYRSMTNWTQLVQYRGEALLVAGRHDQTCDYRTQRHIDRLIPGSLLLLLDDNHVFDRLGKSSLLPPLLQAFAAEGLQSTGFEKAVQELTSEKLMWSEK